MKVFRGQAKNLRKNIKQNNVKPLLVVFGVLVMITLTYKASNGVMGVGNTMFKEGNGKGRRRRQGFEGREGTEGDGSGDGSGDGGGGGGGSDGGGFAGDRKYRTGFQEGAEDCGGVECDDSFKGGRVAAYEGMTSCAKNAAPAQGFTGNRKQGFRGNRRQGFKGRGLRRREGNIPAASQGGDPAAASEGSPRVKEHSHDPTSGAVVSHEEDAVAASEGGVGTAPSTLVSADNFIGSRFGRRRRRR
tara:strand:- start:407 stop:1141 length:735 start_codon:yes stop_codon:yes gene_type:complete